MSVRRWYLFFNLLILLLIARSTVLAQHRVSGISEDRYKYLQKGLPFDLVGPVKSVATWDTIIHKTPNYSPLPSGKCLFLYDSHQRLRTARVENVLYEYDLYGRVVRESWPSFPENGVERHLYKDREQQRVTQRYSADSTSRGYKIDYYAHDTLLIASRNFSPTGALLFSDVYRYDKQNHLTEHRFENTPQGPGITNALGSGPASQWTWPNHTTRFFWEYDKRKEVTRMYRYNHSQLGQIMYRFKSADSVITVRLELQVSLLGELKVHKQIADTTIQESYYTREEVTGTPREALFRNVYVGKDLTKQEYILNNKRQSLTHYSYVTLNDFKGNWVEKTMFEDGIPVRCFYRTIQYY